MDGTAVQTEPLQSPRKRPKSAVLKSLIRPGNASVVGPSPHSDSPSKKHEIMEAMPNESNPQSPSKFKRTQQKTTSSKAESEQVVLGEIQQNRNTVLPSQQQQQQQLPPSPRKHHILIEALKTPQRIPNKSPWRLPHSKAQSVDLGLNNQSSLPKEKENTTPPRSAGDIPGLATPIWAQFTSKPPAETLHDAKSSHSLASTNTTNNEPLRSTENMPGRFNDQIEKQLSNPPADETSSLQRGRQRERHIVNSSIMTPSTKVQETVAMFNNKSNSSTSNSHKSTRGIAQLNAALETVLDAQNIPQNIRENMRNVDDRVKEEFIKHAGIELQKVETSTIVESKVNTQATLSGTRTKLSALIRGRSNSRGANVERKIEDEPVSPNKRNRSRNRAWTFGRGEASSSKRARSNSRPRSLMSLKNFSSSSVNSMGGWDGSKDSKEQAAASKLPEDFITYMREEKKPENVEVGRLHKLRVLLRHESVSWVDAFVAQNGMDELISLLRRTMQIEWREEHEDLLLHEVLLCLKALCTTQKALDQLTRIEASLIPELLQMLFDKERKGPSEFNTRGLVITIMFNHLAAARFDDLSSRAKALLSYLSDQLPPEDERPIQFIDQMRVNRPYQNWCREISNVTKEVFWIFLHHQNIVPSTPSSEYSASIESGVTPFRQLFFPRERPPVPAAPYVGGVEWEATNYLGTHLDLLNGLIASLETKSERNKLRTELKASGFEKLMGGTLRLCKEKFYGAVHDGLRTWVAAAVEDGWDVIEVRKGPQDASTADSSPTKKKGKVEGVQPKLELLPDLQLKLDDEKKSDNVDVDGWL